MKIIFALAASVVCLQQVYGMPTERDETEEGVVVVIALVEEFLASLKNGTRIKNVELAADTIIDNVDAILGASETTVTMSDAQNVIDQVMGLISGGIQDEDLKADGIRLDRDLILLRALVAELKSTSGSGDNKNILSILLAIRTTAAALNELAEEIESEVIISHDPDEESTSTDDDDEFTVRATGSPRGRTCLGVGWNNGKNCVGIGWGRKSKKDATRLLKNSSM